MSVFINLYFFLQAEYSRLLGELHSQDDERCQNDISLNLPPLPTKHIDLGNVLENALNKFYKNQCQIVQGLSNPILPQPQPMPYQACQYPPSPNMSFGVQQQFIGPYNQFPPSGLRFPIPHNMPGHFPGLTIFFFIIDLLEI